MTASMRRNARWSSGASSSSSTGYYGASGRSSSSGRIGSGPGSGLASGVGSDAQLASSLGLRRAAVTKGRDSPVGRKRRSGGVSGSHEDADLMSGFPVLRRELLDVEGGDLLGSVGVSSTPELTPARSSCRHPRPGAAASRSALPRRHPVSPSFGSHHRSRAHLAIHDRQQHPAVLCDADAHEPPGRHAADPASDRRGRHHGDPRPLPLPER